MIDIKNHWSSWLPTIAVMGFFCLLSANQAYASTGMVWETPLETVKQSLEGPVATVITILAIVGAGAMLAVGEFGSTIRRVLQLVIGISIMAKASVLIMSLFGSIGSGVVI